MNTQNLPKIPVEKPLPPLIKKSDTYRLIIPAKIEEKIRYLQRKFPSTEWSGVLFTTHEGSFEENNLVITCKDIYPMDLGNATFTAYTMDESVASYMAENIDLFNCELQLVHSHHVMQAYFSGTDLATLREEGNERNCFVSLIVNNEGTYCAAVTRKMKSKTEVVTKSLATSYQFFGDGEIKTDEDPMSETTEVKEETVIEYFMLDVERETVDNPLSYLDARFQEIEDKKTEQRKAVFTSEQNPKTFNWLPKKSSPEKFEGDDYTFQDWINYKKQPDSPKVIQQELFDEQTMKEMETSPSIELPPETVNKCVAQMLSCSLLINSDKFNIEQWVEKWMEQKYDKIFAEPGSFDAWAEYIVEHIVSNVVTSTTDAYDCYDVDVLQSAVAEAIYAELSVYENMNPYIDQYLEVLNRYIL